ncbi:MAG: FkbM family methyltransferase [Aeromicrobium sp.]
MRGGNAKEIAKLGVRLALHRSGVSIGRDPFVNRVARLLEARGIETVLDVGANVGQFARMVRAAGFDGDILSCEPLSDAYRRLTRRSKGDPRWQTFNTAVGSEPGRSTIHISANSYSSSLLAMTKAHLDAAPGSEFIGSEDVDVTTVAGIVDEHGLNPARMFIKVDTQGYEKAVMAGAGAVIDKVAAVQLELSFVELYEGQELFDEGVATMRDHGLELWTLDPGISDAEGRLLQCDGVFVRPTN